MREQRLSSTTQVVSVIRKPEKSGAPCFPSKHRPGRAGEEVRRGKWQQQAATFLAAVSKASAGLTENFALACAERVSAACYCFVVVVPG